MRYGDSIDFAYFVSGLIIGVLMTLALVLYHLHTNWILIPISTVVKGTI